MTSFSQEWPRHLSLPDTVRITAAAQSLLIWGRWATVGVTGPVWTSVGEGRKTRQCLRPWSSAPCRENAPCRDRPRTQQGHPGAERARQGRSVFWGESVDRLMSVFLAGMYLSGGRGPPRLGTRKAEAGHTSNECSEDTAVISEAQWMARHVSGGVQEGRELDPRWL